MCGRLLITLVPFAQVFSEENAELGTLAYPGLRGRVRRQQDGRVVQPVQQHVVRLRRDARAPGGDERDVGQLLERRGGRGRRVAVPGRGDPEQRQARTPAPGGEARQAVGGSRGRGGRQGGRLVRPAQAQPTPHEPLLPYTTATEQPRQGAPRRPVLLQHGRDDQGPAPGVPGGDQTPRARDRYQGRRRDEQKLKLRMSVVQSTVDVYTLLALSSHSLRISLFSLLYHSPFFFYTLYIIILLVFLRSLTRNSFGRDVDRLSFS